MPQLPYPESSELIAATEAGLYEVFGQDSYTAKLLLGKILGATTLDGLGVVDISPVNPEDHSYDQPPHYAERAIRTNDPEELATLMGEAFNRLSKCLPADHVDVGLEQNSEDDRNLFARRWHGNGTDEDRSLGDIHIHLSQPKSAEELVSRGHFLAKLEYSPGYDGKVWLSEDQSPTNGYVHTLSVFHRLLTDPVTKVPFISTNVYTGYEIRTSAGHKPFGEGYGLLKPLDAKIKATMFYYLDEVITYYETLNKRTEHDEYPEWIGVEESYRKKIYEYLSRVQDIMAYESNSRASSASKELASMP